MTLHARASSHTTIARLEVRADRGDPVVARLAAERLLGAIELRPGSLPPSAILCVRALRDPLPRTVSLASHQLRPPQAWERALQHEVDRLARDAARPARDPVPAAAEAVVFADEAELLTCLGSDLVGGMIAARWWWRLLVDGIEQPRVAAIRACQRAPQQVPAALHALAARGQAAAFVRMLEPGDARTLVDAVAEQFALRAATTGVTPASPRAPIAAASPDVVEPPPVRRAPAPWSAVAPEAEQPALHAEHRALLGVALVIARAPQLARSHAFAIGVAAWRVAIASPGPDEVAPAPPRARPDPATMPSLHAAPDRAPDAREAPQRPTGEMRAPIAAAARVPEETAGAPATALVEGAAMVAPGAPPPPAAAPRARPAVAPAPSEVAAPPVEPAQRAEDAAAVTPAITDEPGAPSDVEHVRRTAPASDGRRSPRRSDRALGDAVTTEHGGLFYLVNLALYLRLYGDDDNLPLPLWDFVALVGRALLDDAAAVDDQVWALLAELTGRGDDDPPGARFMPPTDWRLRPAWLAPFEAVAKSHASPERLVISHAEGFVIVDVEAHADRESQLAVELAPYGTLTCAPAVDELAPLPADTPLDRWLARLLPYLRARLRHGLAIDDSELPALLLAHPARVHVTDTHVDIMLSLESLPIEIRVAGLDRDPGWVAAAGRFIAFHFE